MLLSILQHTSCPHPKVNSAKVEKLFCLYIWLLWNTSWNFSKYEGHFRLYLQCLYLRECSPTFKQGFWGMWRDRGLEVSHHSQWRAWVVLGAWALFQHLSGFKQTFQQRAWNRLIFLLEKGIDSTNEKEVEDIYMWSYETVKNILNSKRDTLSFLRTKKLVVNIK